MQTCFTVALAATWVGALSLLGPWPALGLAVALVLGTSACARVGQRRVPLVGLCFGLIVACATSAEAPTPAVDPNQEVALSGVVSTIDCPTEARCRLRLQPAFVDGESWPRPLSVFFAFLEAPPAAGEAVEFWGRLRVGRRSRNPSAFSHLGRTPGVYAQAITEPTPAGDAASSWLGVLRAGLWAQLGFESPTARTLYRALLLGDRTELDTATRWLFQDTGTAHLLAISGLHVALIGWGFFRLCLLLLSLAPAVAQGRRLPALAAVVTAGFLLVYGAVVVPSQATARALVFVSCVLLAYVLARRTSGPRVLAFALVVVTLIEPSAPLGPSLQLSFAAAAALVFSAPGARRLDVWLREPGQLPDWMPVRLTRVFAALCWVNVVTFAATAPLTLAWFGQVAWAGLWVNLVAVPLMSFVVLPTGALWLVLAALVPAVAGWLSPLPEWTAEGFVTLLSAVGAETSSAVVGTWPIWAGVLAAIGVVLALARRLGWGLGALAFAVLVPACLSGSQGAGDWRVTFLDVGHGDAIAMETPTGATMLIDAGGTWQGGDADRRLADRSVLPSLLALGWDRIDLMVISHADRDHIGGALPLVERIPVGELWLPPCALTDWRAQALMDQVVAGGGTIRTVHSGAPSAWEGLIIEPVWPPFDARRWDGSCRWSTNEASLVLRVAAHGRGLLLTGDIGADAETHLLEAGRALDADVLKVGHHGSKSSSTPAFLDVVGATHAVVSGIPGRLPMPPHPSVLTRLEAGATLWTTGRDGAVTMLVAPDGTLEMTALERVGSKRGSQR